MGLTSWKGNITIAKNYLNEQELSDLNLIVDQYLSFAELQTRRRQIEDTESERVRRRN
jgi:hypothetical protein